VLEVGSFRSPCAFRSLELNWHSGNVSRETFLAKTPANTCPLFGNLPRDRTPLFRGLLSYKRCFVVILSGSEGAAKQSSAARLQRWCLTTIAVIGAICGAPPSIQTGAMLCDKRSY
jgi:hypothetical protein